jgi:hypothetical protein
LVVTATADTSYSVADPEVTRWASQLLTRRSARDECRVTSAPAVRGFICPWCLGR